MAPTATLRNIAPGVVLGQKFAPSRSSGTATRFLQQSSYGSTRCHTRHRSQRRPQAIRAATGRASQATPRRRPDGSLVQLISGPSSHSSPDGPCATRDASINLACAPSTALHPTPASAVEQHAHRVTGAQRGQPNLWFLSLTTRRRVAGNRHLKIGKFAQVHGKALQRAATGERLA